MARKDLLARLADAGEDAIARLGEAPGSDRLLGFAHNMRERMDEMQKKVRGIDELEKRVAALERQLAAQEGGAASSSRPARAPAARKPAASRSRKPSGTAAKKPGSGATEASRSRAASTPKRNDGGSASGSAPDASSTGTTGGDSPG